MQASFAALQAQVTALNSQLADMINLNKSVDPSGFNRLAKAAEANSRVFRDAAASTGLFETQQVRVNSATDEYVKKLNAQKMSFRELSKQRKIATAAYREQLAMEKMMVRRNPASSMHGKDTFDVTYPKAYEQALDTTGNRLRWFNAQLKSGATQMVNWGKNTQWAGRQLMVGFTMPIAAFGAAAGVMAYQVDKEFTRIAKVYDTHADKLTDLAGWEAETAELRAAGYDTARLAAREYQAAITDTLEVQGELAAVGQTGLELQRNTAEVMRIATLGELDNNLATEAAIALQAIWGMNNTELADTFNYLNATENATSLTTQDFATAIPVASAAVKSFGGDIKELGILMTAMKEQGINASEGANALKATMQRLSRPSKQIREEFQALTGQSIVELVDSSSGLIEIFTKLNTITEGLDKNARRDVFAGLFGSYQVARMTALAEGMGNLEDGTGQVAEAARVAGMSTAELAEIAQSEIDALQASISGRFKAALEELKIIMAEMGMPFLKAATTILETLAKIGNAINNMPDAAKTMLGWAVAAAAVAGPLVMLTGLFANLGGNGLKVIAGMITAFGRFSGSMTIADKQSRIYSAAAKMAETQHLSNTKAVQSLTATMDKLVAAQQAANTASQKEAALQSVNIKMSKARKAIEDERIRQMQIQNRLNSQYAQLGVNDRVRYHEPGNPMKSLSEADARSRAAADIDKGNAAQAAFYASQQADAQERGKTAAVATQKSLDRQKVAMVGGSIAAAAMAGSMAAMMLPVGETGQKIAQWAMIGTIVVPAAWTLLRATVAAGAAAGVYAKNMWSGAAATTAAGTAAKGNLLSGIAGLATKGNLATAAIAGIGIAAYAVWDHFRDIREEQKRVDRANASLISQTERWASSTGKVLDGYKKLAAASKTQADTTDMTQRIEFYKSDDEKESTEAYADMGYLEQQTIVTGKFIDMVQGMGMSVKDAKKELNAFLIASGETALGASQKVDRFTAAIEQQGATVMNAREWASEYENTMNTFNNVAQNSDGLEKNAEYLKQLGMQGGKMFSQAFISGSDSEREALRASLEKQILDPWNSITAQVKAGGRSAALAVGVFINEVEGLSGDAAEARLQEVIGSAEEFRSFYMSMSTEYREAFREQNPYFGAAIEEAEELERVIVGPIATALGVAAKDVDTLGELFNDAAVAVETLGDRVGTALVFDKTLGAWRVSKNELEQGIGEVGMKYQEVMGTAFDPNDMAAFNAELTRLQSFSPEDLEKMSDEDRKKIEEQRAALEDLITTLYIFSNGLDIKPGSTEWDQLKNMMTGTQVEADVAADKVKVLKNQLDGLPSRKSIKIDLEVTQDIMNNAWGAVMQGTADVLTDDFDNRMAASQDATQSYWDNRQSALDSEMDRRSNALDAKWEARKDGAEKYWEARIDAVDKAMEAEEKAEERRQKIFEAEMERIDKLSAAANANIDFNVALNSGNLDEAAKIQNDIQAEGARDVMQNAADASQGSSDKKIDRLENKQEDLEAQKDAAMAAMEKREKAEKAHLDKISAMRKKSLEADAAAAIAANEAEWEEKKAAHEASIELLLAGVARSKEELKAMLEHAGIKYETFRQALKDKGLEVNQFIGQTLEHEVEKSAIELRSNAAWSELGKGAMDAMIKAMGFQSTAQFKEFIRTGEMKDILDPDVSKGGKSPAPGSGQKPNDDGHGPQINHKGGWAGAGSTGRSGVPRTTKGLHNSEVMIQAQKGEFIVNKKQAQKNPNILEAINDGKIIGTDGPPRDMIGIGGGGYNYSGIMAGAMMRSLMFGVMKNVENKYKGAKAALQAQQAAAGSGDGAGAMNYAQGPGGWHIPAAPGHGWSNTHDYGAPGGTPLYAVGDGVITESRAIRSGGSSTYPGYPAGYTSYGETVAMRLNNGETFRWAHLQPGTRIGTGPVKGGTPIGRSGMTGNASGYHVHMEGNGSYNASGWLAAHGIPLKEGAAEILMDDLPTRLHKGEGVYTKPLNDKIHQGIDNFANGQPVVYDIDINGEGLETKEIVREVIREIDKRDGRKPMTRTVGNGKRPR